MAGVSAKFAACLLLIAGAAPIPCVMFASMIWDAPGPRSQLRSIAENALYIAILAYPLAYLVGFCLVMSSFQDRNPKRALLSAMLPFGYLAILLGCALLCGALVR